MNRSCSSLLMLAAVLLCHMTAFAADPTATPVAGGDGGEPFRQVAPAGGCLVGFTLSLVSFEEGKPSTLYSVQPIFETPGGRRTGTLAGDPNSLPIRIEARPGYAVGSVTVQADAQVLGLRVEFFRRRGTKLDASDHYPSRWVGGRGGKELKLAGDGQVVVGVAGRADPWGIKALGLLVTPEIVAPSLDAAPVEPLPIPEFHSTPDYEQAVAEARLWSTSLAFDEERPGKPLVKIDLTSRNFTAAKLAVVLRIPTLRTLVLDNAPSRLSPAQIAELGRLPELSVVRTRYCKWFTDEHLAALRRCPRMEELDLRSAGVTGDGLAALGAFPRLKTLWLESDAIGDPAADGIIKARALVTLHVMSTLIQDDGYLRLVELPELKELSILSYQLTDRGVAGLARMGKLQRLELEGDAFSGKSVVEAIRGKKLKTLLLGGHQITDEVLALLKDHTELEDFDLQQTKVTDEGLKSLAGFTNLKTFSIHTAPQVTGAGLAHLPGAKLTYVSAIDCHLDEKAFEWLGACPNLERLQMRNVAVPDGAFRHLAGLAKLRQLYYSISPNGDAAIRELAPLTQLEDVMLMQTRVSGRTLGLLTGVKKLNVSQTIVDDEGLEAIAKLPKLDRLDAAAAGRITDRGVRAFAGHKQLKHLVFFCPELTNEACRAAAEIPSLEHLELLGSPIDDDGIALLKPLARLDHLGLHSSAISDQGLAAALELPRLNMLGVIRTRVSVAGLQKAREKRPYLEAIIGPPPMLQEY